MSLDLALCTAPPPRPLVGCRMNFVAHSWHFSEVKQEIPEPTVLSEGDCCPRLFCYFMLAGTWPRSGWETHCLLCIVTGSVG